jgi:multisubunit Na+/H+ antiporter MnhC subunit
MADETNGQALAPPSEEIHLPEPAYTPVVLAFGITVIVIGVVLTWVMVAIGAIIALVALTRWIRQTREEMAELPLEH